MINLLARFSGDASPIVQEFKKVEGSAKTSGTEAGKFFGQQFKSTVTRFIGAGAVIGTITKLLRDALRIEGEAVKAGVGLEAFQELERAAKLTGMSVKEIQEAAPKVAEQFTKLMAAVRESGGFLDAATVQELANAADELNRFIRNLAPLATALIQGLNFAYRVAGAGGAGIQSAVTGALGAVTGSESLKAESRLQRQIQSDIWNDRGSTIARAQERSAAQGFVGAIRENEYREMERKQLDEMKKQTDKLQAVLAAINQAF